MATEGELRRSEIAAAEARTDTKIARIDGKLDLVISKVEAVGTAVVESRRAMIANGWVIFGAIVALIIGLAAAFPVILDLGMKLDEKIERGFNRHLSTSTQQ